MADPAAASPLGSPGRQPRARRLLRGPRPPLLSLLDEFVACRTTLDDLQQRIAALGAPLRITDIARHLTGKSQLPHTLHNVLVRAINERLTELASPATAQYRQESSSR